MEKGRVAGSLAKRAGYQKARRQEDGGCTFVNFSEKSMTAPTSRGDSDQRVHRRHAEPSKGRGENSKRREACGRHLSGQRKQLCPESRLGEGKEDYRR